MSVASSDTCVTTCRQGACAPMLLEVGLLLTYAVVIDDAEAALVVADLLHQAGI